MNTGKLLILAAYFLAALAAVAAAKEFFEEDKRPSHFIVGSRYGRSGGEGRLRVQKSGTEKVVKARKDQFYVPRYGKRSSESYLYQMGPTAFRANFNELSCVYAGIADLYRCIPNSGNSNSKELDASTAVAALSAAK